MIPKAVDTGVCLLSFLRRWWKLAAGAIGFVGLLLVGMIAWGEYERKAGNIKDSIKAERAKQKIAELRGRRQELAEQDQVDEAEVARIEDELETNRRELESVRSRAAVDATELEQEFARLGF